MTDINTSTVTTGTTPSLTTDYAFTSIAGSLRRMSLGLLGQVIGFIQGGTGATTRTMQDKVREMQISVMDFGATRGSTGFPTTASDTAFANALAWAASSSSLCNKVTVPVGYFLLNNVLDIPPGVRLGGHGRALSNVAMKTTTTGGCITLGKTAADHDITSLYVIDNIAFQYTGTGTSTSIHGIAHTHTLNMLLVSFNGFPGCGLYTDTCWTTPTTGVATDYGPHGSHIEDCVFTQCDTYGAWVRYSAYNILFVNCQFINCGINGYRQTYDGGSSTTLRAITIVAGQASYSEQQGYYIGDGNGFHLYGAYAELNWSPTRTNSGYSNGEDDFYIGDNLTNAWVNIGVLYNQQTYHVRVPGTTWNGVVGSGAAFTIPGGSTFTWGGSSTQWAQTGTNASNVQIWEGGRRGYGVT